MSSRPASARVRSCLKKTKTKCFLYLVVLFFLFLGNLLVWFHWISSCALSLCHVYLDNLYFCLVLSVDAFRFTDSFFYRNPVWFLFRVPIFSFKFSAMFLNFCFKVLPIVPLWLDSELISLLLSLVCIWSLIFLKKKVWLWNLFLASISLTMSSTVEVLWA